MQFVFTFVCLPAATLAGWYIFLFACFNYMLQTTSAPLGTTASVPAITPATSGRSGRLLLQSIVGHFAIQGAFQNPQRRRSIAL
jgi:hypothetical protein